MKTETRHALKHDKFIDQTQQGIGWVSTNRAKVAEIMRLWGAPKPIIAQVHGY